MGWGTCPVSYTHLEYGPVEEEGLPLAVNIEKIVPIRPLLKGLSEAFADPLTGIGADLMDIDTVSYTHLSGNEFPLE